MNIIKIGEPIITPKGTVITKYIENGRFFKSVDFEKSLNMSAKERGLVKTVTRYGEGNKPETVFDTFERRIDKIKSESIKQETLSPEKNITNPVIPENSKKVDDLPKIEPAQPKAETTKQADSRKETIQKLVPVSIDSFKTDTAKTMYSRIKKMIQRVGNSGSISEVKLLNNTQCDENIYLSLNRENHQTRVNVYRKNQGDNKNSTLFNILLDQKGQMTEGRFHPEHLTFERRGSNIRRIKQYDNTYLPVAGNDREWDCYGSRISNSYTDFNGFYPENSVGSAYEIFIELARLHTSLFK